jgi:hypothetical protein
MIRGILLCGVLLAGVALSATGDEKHEHPLPPAPTNAGLEKMKTLVGKWVAADKDGKPTDEVFSIVKLTAGGSAVHETVFPGQPHEMISVYTAEGSDVLMTHYCMLGNQPRLKANGKMPGNKLQFDFAGGSNLDPKKDKHMHGATLIFVDADHLELEGTAWENGEICKEMCSGMKLIRKK